MDTAAVTPPDAAGGLGPSPAHPAEAPPRSPYDAAAPPPSLPRVIGHRDLGHTACPGDALAGQIALIRRQTQKRIKNHSGKCRKSCRRCKRKGGRACVKCKRCKRKAKLRQRKAKLGAGQARPSGAR